jgi:type II secretory pathway component GspD/PulD (secretin)
MSRLLKLVYELDKPTHQVLIKAHIVEATKDTARELGVEWSANTHPSGSNDGDLHYDTGGDFLTAGATLGIIANGPDISLEVQLSALQTDGKINILSSPSIATLDNNQAIIESGTTIPYPNGTDEQGNIIFDQANATLKLTVTPHVIGNTRIKLDIHAQKDEVDATRSVNGVPYILTKNAQTTLIVQNDHTVVIAGLTKEKISATDSGVPWLKDIPFIGRAFKKDISSNEFEDLLIFITPIVLTK